jgi:hypothetical protein
MQSFHSEGHVLVKKKGKEVPILFQEVKVPRLHDNGTGWW